MRKEHLLFRELRPFKKLNLSAQPEHNLPISFFFSRKLRHIHSMIFWPLDLSFHNYRKTIICNDK